MTPNFSHGHSLSLPESVAWELAACAGDGDPDMWFHETWPKDLAYRKAREHCLAVCRSCPIRLECLGYALSIRDMHGFWGGMNPRERAKLGRQLAGEAS